MPSCRRAVLLFYLLQHFLPELTSFSLPRIPASGNRLLNQRGDLPQTFFCSVFEDAKKAGVPYTQNVGMACEEWCGDRTWKTKEKEDIYEDGTLLRIAEAVR